MTTNEKPEDNSQIPVRGKTRAGGPEQMRGEIGRSLGSGHESRIPSHPPHLRLHHQAVQLRQADRLPHAPQRPSPPGAFASGVPFPVARRETG